MTIWKSSAFIIGAAVIIFALNGLVNYNLLQPLTDGPEAINLVRYHLDDAAFMLLFVFAGVVFLGMFAVLLKERGYLYLGVLSFLTSFQLFTDWDEKALLFGAFPDFPYISLVIKSGTIWLVFSFTAYLLGVAKEHISRVLNVASGVLWGTVVIAALWGAGESFFNFLYRVFFLLLFLNIAYYVTLTVARIRGQKHQEELQWITTSFILFTLVVLPDIGKDVLEDIAGHSIGYRLVYWEQCLEDTFAWALLELISVFGVLFFRRFVQTLKENKSVTEQMQLKNNVLNQEVDTRQRLDQILSVLTRAYRVADLEQSVIHEGQRYFKPYKFFLVKYDQTDRRIQVEGTTIVPSIEDEILSALHTDGNRLIPGEARDTSRIVLGVAGGTGDMKLFLAVCSETGMPIHLEERETFALLLMAKYVSIFYEYFHLIENRLNELEHRQGNELPWISKLFMQIAERERKRLASDLHDEVLQELLNIRRLLERSTDGGLSGEHKDQIRRGLENAEFIIRETCNELMPSFLSDHGVLHAITKLVEKTRLRADFQLEYEMLPITDSITDEQTTTVYRIVQELINNALKHSEAGRVKLVVGQEGSCLIISYTDDGKGMKTNRDFSPANRFGLIGVAERARMVGGTVTLQSQPGQGLKVECVLPL
jgi:signal transduction histidine kinase